MLTIKSRQFWRGVLSARPIFTVVDDAIETLFGGSLKRRAPERKIVIEPPEVVMAKSWQMVGDAMRDAMEQFARENNLPAPSHVVNQSENNGKDTQKARADA